MTIPTGGSPSLTENLTPSLVDESLVRQMTSYRETKSHVLPYTDSLTLGRPCVPDHVQP